jgi:hypothetical protein
MHSKIQIHLTVLVSAILLLATLPALAQSNPEKGRLKVQVNPKQAYVFVDGKAIRDSSQTIDLAAGTHQLSVRNYGYTPNTQTVHIGAGETTDVKVTLEATGDRVAGPFGDIEFKGDPRAAVLLNGTTPDYFVGHVDEFDWNWIWHQRLLVNAGTYQVTVTRKGNTIWSGPVAVKAGKQVTVYLNENGRTKTKDWPEGLTMRPQPRFHAGIASATVPVAPVTAQLTAQSSNVGCGQPTDLRWRAADAVSVTITNLGNVSAKGDRSVSPTKTTQYELAAKGPGGDITKTVTVNVAEQPTATISVSEPEVHYHKIGDKVVQDNTVTLRWSTSNANKVSIASLGNEPPNGSQQIEVKPDQTTAGPVDEMVHYNLTASNACGGSASQTALLHVVGSIDPAPAVTLASVFYPTDYPKARSPKVGLVASERQILSQAASRYDNHEQYDNDRATLMVVGHADVRGPKGYNLQLSERRAEAVKSYLVSKGISADKIQVRAEGKQKELGQQDVASLQSKDPQKPEKWMTHRAKATWLAYNRRVDIILEPTGQQSTEAYPNDVSDARILWQRPAPSLKAVESASKTPGTSGALNAGLTQN